jgi:hypothetical protein
LESKYEFGDLPKPNFPNPRVLPNDDLVSTQLSETTVVVVPASDSATSQKKILELRLEAYKWLVHKVVRHL